jgi:Xaa-Pro aminopeptidase
MHRLLDDAGLGTAWERETCPAVTAGADSPVGHAGPQAQYVVRPGSLVHLDFGVKLDDYCADLQRVWYVRQGGEVVPAEVQQAFDATQGALLAGFEALRPGAEGWQVDEAARRALVSAGYPEYQHAFGHHVGRAVHDGATILGPRWERYGHTPEGVIEAGNVFAIELDVSVPGYGLVGLEENVFVAEDGARWLSNPQTEVWVIG